MFTETQIKQASDGELNWMRKQYESVHLVPEHWYIKRVREKQKWLLYWLPEYLERNNSAPSRNKKHDARNNLST